MSSRVPPLHPDGPTDLSGNRPPGRGEDPPPEAEKGQGPPKGVAVAMWEKFQALKKKREDVTKASTEKRIKEIQEQALCKVEEALTTESDKDILREHKVECDNRKRKSSPDSAPGDPEGTSRPSASSSSTTSASSEESWFSIKPYLDVNSHLQGIDKGRHAPKTKLELQIDKAISEGDLKTAETLSEHLANREFGKKIADAIDAKRFSEKKQKEEDISKVKRRKKLPWGFDHKERWETKGNM